MKPEKNIDLKPYNTFGVSVPANEFCRINHEDDLTGLHTAGLLSSKPVLILGQGSNILFTRPFQGIVLYNRLMGRKVVEENEKQVSLKVGSGESWPNLVDYCVANKWAGIENLSLIPGTAGAAPVQNIGAYGVELKNVLESVEVFDLVSGSRKTFQNHECNFGYRDSIFKSEFKGRYFILNITLRLSKKMVPVLSYGPIQQAFADRDTERIAIEEISEEVKKIRRLKLPDPSRLGNAGSFFKNPVVPYSKIEELISTYPDMPFYKVDENNFKMAAGWLIEKAGWKGKRMGDAGVHEKQALVLVNYGNATGSEIFQLSEEIRASVFSLFGIELEREVTVL